MPLGARLCRVWARLCRGWPRIRAAIDAQRLAVGDQSPHAPARVEPALEGGDPVRHGDVPRVDARAAHHDRLLPAARQLHVEAIPRAVAVDNSCNSAHSI